MTNFLEWGLNVGEESRKTWKEKVNFGFFNKYMSGSGLDIGGTGYLTNVHAILPTATIVDLNYPGYDGLKLPFESNSQDYVYSSHCLEHIDDPVSTVIEWFRVIKPGGHMIITVPHQWLYERKRSLPSQWNADHKMFYTPAKLLQVIEHALPVNTYRIRHLQDNDEGHTYGVPVEIHADGQYDIELVCQKL